MTWDDSGTVRETQFCHPPVPLTGTLAMSGPVVEPSRYWIVPVADDPDARRVSTLAGEVASKSTPSYHR